MSEFVKVPDGRPFEAISTDPLTTAIVFVGSALSFSPLVMRIVQSEFVGIDVFRVESLSQLESRPDGSGIDLRIAVFDQSHAECIGQNFAHIRSRLRGAQMLFGYCDAAVARRLYAQADIGAELRFLPMNVQVDAWISILRLFLSGQHYVPEEVLPPPVQADLRPSATQKSPLPPNAASRLTERELAVLARVSEGEQNKLIAKKLGVSEHTVKLHIHNAIAKISARNRTEAAIWYLSRASAAESGSAG